MRRNQRTATTFEHTSRTHQTAVLPTPYEGHPSHLFSGSHQGDGLDNHGQGNPETNSSTKTENLTAVRRILKSLVTGVSKIAAGLAKLATFFSAILKYTPAALLATTILVGGTLVLPKLAALLVSTKLAILTIAALKSTGVFLLAHSPAIVVNTISLIAAKLATVLTLGGTIQYGALMAHGLSFMSAALNSVVNFILMQGQILTGLTAFTAKTGLAGTVAAGVAATALELTAAGVAIDQASHAVIGKKPIAFVADKVNSIPTNVVSFAYKSAKSGVDAVKQAFTKSASAASEAGDDFEYSKPVASLA